jgi:hypothetical protein
VCRGTTDWEKLTQNFKVTFNFEDTLPLVDVALQFIRGKKFMEEGEVEIIPTYSVHKEFLTVHELLECYNVTKEEEEEENLRNV